MSASTTVGDKTGAGKATRVPFFDPAPMHAPLKGSILDDIAELIDSGAFTNASWVARFESEFAAYCGIEHCVGVANGLDGLRLTLLAAGLEPGDEVIVPANTFIATLEAVSQAGGVPVIVDADERDRNISVEQVEAAITNRTRFVMPVHLYGQMADMVSLSRIAERARIDIVEDACQAHGATRDGLRAGSVGRGSAFSFYPAKNLGAFGDAGAMVTADGELASTVRILREHGQRRKYEHELKGFTSRLDSVQALALHHKLPLLDGWNAERADAARYYSDRLAGVGDLELPPVAPNSSPVWHLYVVHTAKRDELADYLREREIGTSFHYPEPVHLSRAYTDLGYGRGAFPVAERLAAGVISLPIFPGITAEQLEAVGDVVESFYQRG